MLFMLSDTEGMEKQKYAEGQQPKPSTAVSPATFNTLLNEKQTAEYLNVSLSFLRRRRSQGCPDGCTPGPRYLKLGKSIRYRLTDLDTWLDEHLQEVA